jgi:WD40 repeat protein
MPDANDVTRTQAPEAVSTDVGATADFPGVPGHEVTASFPTDPVRIPASVSIPGYDIECLLGRGGMGVVYKARHLALKRTVALKLILAGAHAGPQQLARFRIEAEAAARLPHPNIVQIHEVGAVDGRPYCALEFVEGGHLASKLNGKPMPAREAAKLVETLARAMQLAHSRNVVHRDLKPANILLTADGTPKISDFGLARQMDSDSGETQAGAVMGTPSYMAPEQASGHAHEAGPAADVYALGAILYDCLAGRPPFMGETVVETLDQVRTQEPKPPSHWQSNVPPDLDTICLKCLRKEPENRYASAAELAAELVRFLNGEPILARPIGRFERSVKWVMRNPVVTGAVAAVALALATGTTVSYLKYRDAEEQREAADQATAAARREREAERWERYRSNLIAAGSAMQLHNVSAATASLEAAPEEHRGWEWRHYQTRLDTSQDSRFVGSRSGGPRFSAGGTLLSLGTSEKIWIWDVAGRKEVASLADVSHPGSLCFSRDGTLVAHSRRDNTVEIREVAGNRSRILLQGATMLCTVPEFSPDSTKLACGSYDRIVRVWDVKSGKLIQALPGDEAIAVGVRFSPDGRWLAADGRDIPLMRIWDLTTGKVTKLLSVEKEGLSTVHYNPSGDRIVASECYPQTNLRMWNPADGKLIAVLRGHTNEATHYAFTTDGSRLATGSTDQNICIWDGRTGALIRTLKGHAGWVEGIAFSPDGKRLVSSSQDQTVRLWDPETGAPLAILHGHTNDVLDVSWSADGSTITSVSGDGIIRWWDAKQAERYGMLRDHEKFVYSVAFHPDGERVASAAWDGTVRLWNATTSEQIGKPLQHPEKSVVASVAFHPAGKLLATMCRMDGIRVWAVDSGKVVHRLPLTANTWRDSRLAFSPDGEWLACGKEHEVRVWSVNTWAEAAVLSGHKDFVRDVVFAPDGAWLASGAERGDPVVRIWDLKAKKQLAVLEGHESTVYALAVSRDGKWLASGSIDGTVRLWDTTTWTHGPPLKHGVNVYGLSFTPDGTRLASACANNTIRLWDLATRQLVAELHGHGDYVHQVAWSPDGTRLVSGSGDKTLRVWDSLSARDRAKRGAEKPHSN